MRRLRQVLTGCTFSFVGKAVPRLRYDYHHSYGSGINCCFSFLYVCHFVHTKYFSMYKEEKWSLLFSMMWSSKLLYLPYSWPGFCKQSISSLLVLSTMLIFNITHVSKFGLCYYALLMNKRYLNPMRKKIPIFTVNKLLLFKTQHNVVRSLLWAGVGVL